MTESRNQSRSQARSIPLSKTGIPGLDLVLAGGLPSNRVYMFQGEPGTGKTTLALQFLLEGLKLGEKCLYITFSETREELEDVAQSHGWDISGLELFELSAIEDRLKAEAQNTLFHPAEVELNETTQALLDRIIQSNPVRIVFDSLSEMRLLAETPLRYRRQMLAFKQFFAGRQSTVLLLDDRTAAPGDLHVQSIVHGVITLQKLYPEFGGERRRLTINKLRGVKFVGGYHDYVIERGGIKIFPRMISSEYSTNFQPESISSGIPELDELTGGGIDRGTSTLFMGPAGTGKSTLALQYAVTAADRGEHVALYLFEESLNTMIERANTLGLNLKAHLDSGQVTAQKIDPAELSPGEFASIIRDSVDCQHSRMIVIDSLNGYLHAMPEEQFLVLQLHELLSYLSNKGVATIMVLAQQGMMGMMQTPVDLTYLADTVIITRFFEAAGQVKKAVAVLKKRSGTHETTIREFGLDRTGIRVGKPLTQFQGVLTGVPTFRGSQDAILKES